MKLRQEQVDKLREGKATGSLVVYREPELIKAGDERVLLGMLRTPPKLDVRVVEEENYKLLIKPPKTLEERDQIVKKLQAMEFKKELPSELEEIINDVSHEERLLVRLIRRRDVYRDGLKPYECDVKIGYGVLFSLQDKETAELFLNNFKEELEQVKHLIS